MESLKRFQSDLICGDTKDKYTYVIIYSSVLYNGLRRRMQIWQWVCDP